MRAGHRPNPMALASLLAAVASLSFAGAQRKLEAEDVRPMAFDPLALLRRPPRKERRVRGWSGAHCGAKQTAKYANQISAEAFNVHFERRMAWNETVYPRVLELQAKQRERSR